jgi:hypothetical protein
VFLGFINGQCVGQPGYPIVQTVTSGKFYNGQESAVSILNVLVLAGTGMIYADSRHNVEAAGSPRLGAWMTGLAGAVLWAVGSL